MMITDTLIQTMNLLVLWKLGANGKHSHSFALLVA